MKKTGKIISTVLNVLELAGVLALCFWFCYALCSSDYDLMTICGLTLTGILSINVLVLLLSRNIASMWTKQNKCESVSEQDVVQLINQSLVLYSALYDLLEKDDPENVASRIDYLTKQDNGNVNDMYKELLILRQKCKRNKLKGVEDEKIDL